MFDGVVNKTAEMIKTQDFELEKAFWTSLTDDKTIMLLYECLYFAESAFFEKRSFPVSAEKILYVKGSVCLNWGWLDAARELKGHGYTNVLMHFNGFKTVNLNDIDDIVRVIWTRSYDVFSVYNNPIFSIYDGDFFVVTVANNTLDVYSLGNCDEGKVKIISDAIQRIHVHLCKKNMINYSFLVSVNDRITIHSVSYPDDPNLIVDGCEKKYVCSVKLAISGDSESLYAVHRKMPFSDNIYVGDTIKAQPHHHNLLISVDPNEYRHSNQHISWEIEGIEDSPMFGDLKKDVYDVLKKIYSNSRGSYARCIEDAMAEYSFCYFWGNHPDKRKVFLEKACIEIKPIQLTEDKKIITSATNRLTLRDYIVSDYQKEINPTGYTEVLERAISYDTRAGNKLSGYDGISFGGRRHHSVSKPVRYGYKEVDSGGEDRSEALFEYLEKTLKEDGVKRKDKENVDNLPEKVRVDEEEFAVHKDRWQSETVQKEMNAGDRNCLTPASVSQVCTADEKVENNGTRLDDRESDNSSELLTCLQEIIGDNKKSEEMAKGFDQQCSFAFRMLSGADSKGFPHCLRTEPGFPSRVLNACFVPRSELRRGKGGPYLRICGQTRTEYAYCEQKYHDLLNPTRIAIAENKTLTLMLAQMNNIRVPETLFFDTLDDLVSGVQTVEETFGYPVYLKSSLGGAGTGVTRIETRDALMRQVEFVRLVGYESSYLVQKEVKGADRYCVRVIGLYGQIYCSYSRSGGKDGKASIAAGGEAKPIKLTGSQRELVHKLLNIFRCDIVGFDFFVQDGEWLFNEVNPYYAGFNGPISFGMNVERDFIDATNKMFKKKEQNIPLYTGEYKDIPQDIVISHMELVGASTQLYKMCVLEENGIPVRNFFVGNQNLSYHSNRGLSGDLFVKIDGTLVDVSNEKNIPTSICEYGYYNVSADFTLVEIKGDKMQTHHIGKGHPNALVELPAFLEKVKSLIPFDSLVLAYDTSIVGVHTASSGGGDGSYQWCVVTIDGMMRELPQMLSK